MKYLILMALIAISGTYVYRASAEDSGARSAKSSSENTEETYRVSNVVDGDTIDVSTIGRIRLIGVDTPETKHPNKPVERFGKEASNFLKEYLKGKLVRLEFDQQQSDRYGRTLAYVYLLDGTLVNAKIIENGLGHAYTKYPFQKIDSFRNLEKSARESKRGLWADTDLATAYTMPVKESGCIRKTCSMIATYEEAMYLLNTCGFRRLDGDSDGTPCEKLCGN